MPCPIAGRVADHLQERAGELDQSTRAGYRRFRGHGLPARELTAGVGASLVSAPGKDQAEWVSGRAEMAQTWSRGGKDPTGPWRKVRATRPRTVTRRPR